MRKRSNTVYVRFSDSEYAKLKDRLNESGQTLQSYIINSALGARITSRDEAAELHEKNRCLADIDRQLRGMATNLNQLAHVANGIGEVPAAGVMQEMLDDVRALRSEVNDEWLSTRRSINQQRHTGQ